MRDSNVFRCTETVHPTGNLRVAVRQASPWGKGDAVGDGEGVSIEQLILRSVSMLEAPSGRELSNASETEGECVHRQEQR